MALCALLVPLAAQAHMGSLTYADVRLEESALRYDIEVGPFDLYEPLGFAAGDPARGAQVSAPAARAKIAEFVARRVSVANNGRACPPDLDAASVDPVDKADGTAAAVHLMYRCERRLEDVVLTYQLFFDADLRHESFTKVELDGTLRQHVFTAASRTWRITREVSAWDNMRDYLALGIEHIFTGYDHILFLLGLLLIAGVDGVTGKPRGLSRGLVYTLKIVTAFTLAHSLTLIAAALGLVRLPTRLVESCIALSIAYVGAENVAVREPRRRWLLTFVFGLIHGFGFASVLREIGLPKRGLIASLLSFNVGVEVGQLAIVCAMFPGLHVLARAGAARGWYRRVVLVGGSCAIVAFAAFWFVQRAFGVTLLGGWLGK